MPVSIRRLWSVGLAVLLAAHAGCEPLANESLVVATAWPAADRGRLEEGFTAWLRERPDSAGREPSRIRWLVMAPGDDVAGLAARRHPPDVLLGGQARSYVLLASKGRLAPLPIDRSPHWAVSRVARIGQYSPHRDVTRAAEGNPTSIAFDDPRKDPISLAWAEIQLGDGNFSTQYARLIQEAGKPHRIGRLSGSSVAAADRGETAKAVGVVSEDEPGEAPIPWIEGVAIPAAGGHRERAISFVKFLSETGHASFDPRGPSPAIPDDLGLLADLLGATLVDAQDELWAAWAALRSSRSSENQLRWMTEPPPWPPASINKILERQGDQAMAMLESLAGQLATDADSRAWLVSSWLSPPRPIDRRVLEDLRHAADGRLVREPRFREWLRAEWTAWARQRYRRVLRTLTQMGGSAP